jgi:hypothetical protein
MVNRNTLQYISDLKKDPFTADYFRGFSNESSSKVAYWGSNLAEKAASFVKES